MSQARTVGERVTALTGRAVTGVVAIGGGHIGSAWRVRTPQGPLFAKTLDEAPDGFFDAEVAGLAWLAEPGFLAVPRVLGHTRDVLVLEFVASAGPTRATVEAFGRNLARLHAAGADGFGAVPPGGGTAGFLSALGVQDRPVETWIGFFVHQRLEPLTAEAERRGALGEGTRGRVERLAARLGDDDGTLTGPVEPPARLHGDLWAGNVVWGADGRGWLIDPAAHGGHRESDLAMMRLFGGFDEAVFAAYAEVAPLAQGWQERVGLHQLPPLLVHACLFGEPYGAAVDRIVRRYDPGGAS